MLKKDAYEEFRTTSIQNCGFVDPQEAFKAGVKWAEQYGKRSFNVNDAVRIKLTPTGKAKLLADHAIFTARLPERVRRPYRPPFEDENGWSTWQMWHFMACLGHHLSLGAEMPFDAVIVIKSPYGE